jgi:deoxyribodipyrimidine photolyase-related protein
MAKRKSESARSLVIVLGDQLNLDSAAFDDFDRARDTVWMAEVSEEATHVWSHKARIALFLSAMRHFHRRLAQRRFTVDYRRLDAQADRRTLAEALEDTVRRRRPERLVVVEPGEWRVRQSLQATADRLALPLEVRPDRHFICPRDRFDRHARGRKQLRL